MSLPGGGGRERESARSDGCLAPSLSLSPSSRRPAAHSHPASDEVRPGMAEFLKDSLKGEAGVRILPVADQTPP